jgi:hypothetical protein
MYTNDVNMFGFAAKTADQILLVRVFCCWELTSDVCTSILGFPYVKYKFILIGCFYEVYMSIFSGTLFFL